VAGYLLVGAAAVLIWATVLRLLLGRADISPLAHTYNAGLFLLVQAQIPFLIIVVTGSRRLRSVSPLVLAGLLVFCFSNLFVTDLVRWTIDVPSLRWLVVYLAQTEMVFMLAALPIGYGCWRIMRWLSARFERKAFSDTQLLVDTWWLIVAFYESMQLAVGFGWGGLLTLLAFVAYRLVVAVGLKLWPVDPAPNGRGRLLLLRVFGFRRRSERLFDAIAQRWRLQGSVRLIAAADLAMRTLDPGDTIRFLGGRLRRLFVRDTIDLADRLAQVDETRDPDGRFRLAKFFCHDDTWRPTLQALLGRSDAVLMDLRGFSAKNSGCVYELQQLVATGLLRRTLFVVDATTDVTLLERTLGRATDATDGLNLERLTSRSPAAFDHVLKRLTALAAAPA
jgi:hypothetical protein